MGICYEKGLGAQRNLGEAVKCYQQAAAMGNEPARERLRTLFNVEAAGNTNRGLLPPELSVLRQKRAEAPGLLVGPGPSRS